MLFIIVIIALFIRCSHQLLVRTHHNNFSATLYEALYWSSCVDFERLTYFVIVLPFSCQCFSCVKTIQLIFVANLMTGFYLGSALAWNWLSTCLYYLVFINVLPFNRTFVMFLLRTALESNQVLTDVFKNVNM